MDKNKRRNTTVINIRFIASTNYTRGMNQALEVEQNIHRFNAAKNWIGTIKLNKRHTSQKHYINNQYIRLLRSREIQFNEVERFKLCND